MSTGRQFAFTFTQQDLFRGFNEHIPLKFRHKKMTRKELSAKIFADTFFEILLDIIKNNVTFVLPLNYGEYAEICIEPIEGEKFKEMYKKGSFRKVDYVLSQFTANRFKYKYRTKNNGMKEKHIYINKALDELLLKYTNEGKQYY